MSHRHGEGQRPFSPSELEHCAEFPDPVSKNDFGSAFWSRFKTSAPPIECQEPAALRPDGWRHCRTKNHSVVVYRVCAAACYGSKRSKTHTDQERLGGLGGHLTSARRLCPLHHVLHTFPGHPQSLNFSWEDQTGFPMSRGGSPAESPRQSPPLLARVVRPGVTSIPGPGSAAEATMPAPSSQRLLHPERAKPERRSPAASGDPGSFPHRVAAHRRPSRFFQSAKQLEGNPFPLSSILGEKKSESAGGGGGKEKVGRGPSRR